MFRIAVHLHLYYFEMWEIIKYYLDNIDQPYHLFITMVSDNEELKLKILQFHKDTTFFIVPNKGYDVGPFIYVINKINLDDFDLLLKIHTKKNQGSCDTRLNGKWVDRKNWFRLLISSLIGNRTLFNKNIEAFKNEDSLGMIGSRYLITSEPKVSQGVKNDVETVMQKLHYKKPEKIEFVAGTMFIVRTSILKKIAHEYTLDDFETTDGAVKDGTFAHTMERVFGCVAYAEGYHIKGLDRDYNFEYHEKITSIKRLVYSKKITSNNYKLVKIFKIPVYHRKLL